MLPKIIRLVSARLKGVTVNTIAHGEEAKAFYDSFQDAIDSAPLEMF